MTENRRKPKVIAVVPAYNEEQHIKDVITKLLRHVDEVIMVDDGSKDKTSEIASKLGIKPIRHEKNMGKGAALRTGIKEALEHSPDIIVLLDADGQHNPDEIPKLISTLSSGYDLVCGVRNISRSSGMPFQRVLSNKITSTLLKILYGVNISDVLCGFRAGKREVFEKITLKEDRFNVEGEMLIEATRKGFKIGEVQISTIYGKEKSKISPIKDSLRFIYFIIKRKFKT